MSTDIPPEYSANTKTREIYFSQNPKDLKAAADPNINIRIAFYRRNPDKASIFYNDPSPKIRRMFYEDTRDNGVLHMKAGIDPDPEIRTMYYMENPKDTRIFEMIPTPVQREMYDIMTENGFTDDELYHQEKFKPLTRAYSQEKVEREEVVKNTSMGTTDKSREIYPMKDGERVSYGRRGMVLADEDGSKFLFEEDDDESGNDSFNEIVPQVKALMSDFKKTLVTFYIILSVIVIVYLLKVATIIK